jgi:nitrite reductase/ring-hydroxylating ferredoxin subunit
VLVRGFFKDIGAMAPVTEVIRNSLKGLIAENQLPANPEDLGHLHETVAPDRLPDFIKQTESGLAGLETMLYHRSMVRGFKRKQPAWICRAPVFRVHVPYDHAHQHRQEFEQFRAQHGNGRLTSLRPHRDSWFDEPLTCVAMWVALSPVRHGNGMSFFTQDYDRPMSFQRRQGVTRQQDVSEPVNISMEPGDAVFFHANHLHASEVNRTDSTRVALTMRFAIDEPRLSMKKPWRYLFSHPKLPAGLLWYLQTQRRSSGVSRRLLPLLLRYRNDSSYQRAAWSIGSEVTGSQSDNVASPERISLQDLTPDTAIAVSENHMLLRSDTNGSPEVWKTSRWCPHEGADLSLGCVKDGQIHCPWHNLPIDFRTGMSACSTMSIASEQCRVSNGSVDFETQIE